jgi:UDP:flavonoid glycosyltransferase YjiC (YdhE family)
MLRQSSKFLIAVWPLAGHYFPLIAIAHALRRDGHEVAFYTGAAARPAIEAEGFECFPFQTLDEAEFEDLMAARGQSASRAHPLRMKALLRRWLLGTLPQQVEDLTLIMAEWHPDIILSETSMWAPMLVLRETHAASVAVFSTVAACMLPGPDAPPFGLGLPRPRGWPARLIMRLARGMGDLFAADFRAAANELRACYGLPPLRVSVTEYIGQMPLYLMPSVPEFDYMRCDLPESVRYIGPVLWSRPHTGRPLELRPAPQCWPSVHVTEGTIHAQ